MLLSLWSCSMSPFWYEGVFSNLEVLWTHYHWDFMEASSHRHHQLLSPFSATLSSLENGGGARKFQASNHGWVFSVPSQEPTRSPPRDASVEQRMLLLTLPLRNLWRFWELCARNPGERTLYIFYNLSFPSLRIPVLCYLLSNVWKPLLHYSGWFLNYLRQKGLITSTWKQKSNLLLIGEWYSIECYLLKVSPVLGRLSCFQCLAIMNETLQVFV